MKIELVARVCHEANRSYCESIGDMSHVAWEQAPQWQKDSAILGVKGVLGGNSPSKSHESWMLEKVRTGWVYGPVKDAELKTHPCMLPYDELPPAQRVKDEIFVGVVRLLALKGE